MVGLLEWFGNQRYPTQGPKNHGTRNHAHPRRPRSFGMDAGHLVGAGTVGAPRKHHGLSASHVQVLRTNHSWWYCCGLLHGFVSGKCRGRWLILKGLIAIQTSDWFSRGDVLNLGVFHGDGFLVFVAVSVFWSDSKFCEFSFLRFLRWKTRSDTIQSIDQVKSWKVYTSTRAGPYSTYVRALLKWSMNPPDSRILGLYSYIFVCSS